MTRRSAPAPAPGYRRAIASRVLAAVVGGYGVAGLLSSALAVLLPRLTSASAADGVLLASLLGFAFYTAAAVWVFAARTATRAWLGLAGVALASGAVLVLARTAG